MKVQVQAKYKLDEKLLDNIWHRSAPIDECFSDWRRESQTDLGAFSSDSRFFWGNLVRTNKGLSPVFTDMNPEDWRIVVNFDNTDEAEMSAVISESNISVYVYRFDNGELTGFRLVLKDGLRLLESRVYEIPGWLAEKIAAAKKERSPDAVLSRLDGLAARLQQIKNKKRRD